MQTSRPSQAAPPLPSPAEMRIQLDRILSAGGVSPRLQKLLRYLVEETLADRGDRLKGSAIAIDVFGRDESFDPQSDPVVRLEARRLRQDLDSYYMGAGSDDPLRITVPKGGYVPSFEWRTPEGPGGSGDVEPPASTAEDRDPRETDVNDAPGRRRPRLWAGILGVLAAIMGATIAWLWFGDAAPPPSLRSGAPSVIVLPFNASSVAGDDRLLAAGLTQEIIVKLMQFPDLRLFSAQSSFRQDADADPETVARELGAAYVVSGTLLSVPQRVRVAAQLEDGATGEVIWSNSYDQPLTPGDLISVQDSISADIAAALGQPYGVVRRTETERRAGAAPDDMSSYACMLQAYEYRRNFGSELYRLVRACLEKAVATDPGYAQAWAMLGWMHLDAVRFWGGDPQVEFPLALDAASQARVIDDRSTVAIGALSAIHHYMGDYDESVRLGREALALNPNDPETLAQLGWRLSVRGNFDEGVLYLQRAIARTVDPPAWYFHLIAVHHLLQGDYEAMLAVSQASAGGGSGISQSFIAIAYGGLGDEIRAHAALKKMAEIDPELERDPAAVYRSHQATDEIVAALMTGLHNAGWVEPPSRTP